MENAINLTNTIFMIFGSMAVLLTAFIGLVAYFVSLRKDIEALRIEFNEWKKVVADDLDEKSSIVALKEHKDSVAANQTAIWSRLETFQGMMNSMLQGIGRIEGKMDHGSTN